MNRFRQLSPDSVEFGWIKAIVLFTPGTNSQSFFFLLHYYFPFCYYSDYRCRIFLETRGLSESKLVETLQDEAQCGLGEYVKFRYPGQAARFGRFLLLLPSLQTVKPSTVERLFFRETIGAIPLARLLGDMYQMENHHSSDVPLTFRGE